MNVGVDGRGGDQLRGLGPVMSVGGGDPARILVVDDDPVMNRMVVDYLENRNLRAISASGRQEMFRLLAVGDPSLVLLDLRLGRDDEFDLLNEIRSRSDVPVIIAKNRTATRATELSGSSLVPMTASPSRSAF